MQRYRFVAAIVVGLMLGAALALPAGAAGERDKRLGDRSPAGGADQPRRLKRAEKPVAKAPARRSSLRSAEERARQFAGRAVRGASSAEFAPAGKASSVFERGPVTLAGNKGAAKAAGVGGGDVFESEPNDTTAQTLRDLPVNVEGTIASGSDSDCYAVSVTAGAPLRIEVVADRVLGSPLDSFVTVLRDDGVTVIASNDDGYDDSVDSFVRFTAPYSGTVFVCVQDARGQGASDFDYILNVTVANPPDLGEEEPNDSLNRADAFPTVTVGGITGPQGLAFGAMDFVDDLDVYTFDGVAGTTLVVDVDAQVFGSVLDPIVGFYDDGGGILFANDDADNDPSTPDSLFNIVLPYTGTYFVSVADFNGGGNSAGDFYYSLSLTTQSGAGAPRVVGVRVTADDFVKAITGGGFDPAGAYAELTTVEGDVSRPISGSRPAPRKPTTQIKIRPAIQLVPGDVLTVVNRDGRRSNPGVFQ